MTPDHRTGMKMRVAHTIKWNIIDKVLTQALYAVTGIVLANLLTQADFGLVGAILIFQAFASLFVDSGFSNALIQRKHPTDTDYSTVLWFNLAMAAGIYLLLYICAPLIALCFQNDQRIIPLSRVMFLSFIINASAIVQTNRLMKRMEVKMIAVSNSCGLVVSAVVGISLALFGYGAWAIVWQTLTLASVKSLILWCTSSWRPMMVFSRHSLASIFKVGSGIMTTAFLNTLFQNIYGFFIGNRAGMISMGYFYQAEKWSKMGIASLSSVLMSSFLPLLSQYQNDPKEFAAVTAKVNRFTAYITFPTLGMLAVVTQPLFHILFGTKWDPSITLFHLLLFKGVFTILVSLYNNYILALGRARLLVYTEILRDAIAIIAIILTLPYLKLSTPGDLTEGVRIFLWGQVISSAITWVITLIICARLAWCTIGSYFTDLLPYAAETILAISVMFMCRMLFTDDLILLTVQIIAGMTVYVGVNYLLKSKIQKDILQYLHLRH